MKGAVWGYGGAEIPHEQFEMNIDETVRR